MSELATRWALWMLPLAWQVTLVAAAVLVLDLLLRRVAWPQLLHALWLLVPVCAMLPAIALPFAGTTSGTSVATPAAPPVAWFLAWSAGVALILVARIRRRPPRGAPFEDPAFARAAARLGLRRRVALHRAPAETSPSVTGLLRPRIAMPPNAWTEREREHVYLHELAHVQRGDLWVQAAFGLVHAALWFHPLVFVARRRAHALRELACDARVASVLRDQAPAYRATLLRVAARLLAPPEPGAAGFLGGSALILQRLRRLESGEWVYSRGKRVATAAFVLAALVTLVPLAQAQVVDPAVGSLRTALEQRARHLSENYESEGCLELHWTVRRLLHLQQQEKESK